MAVTLNASTSTGLVQSADTSGIIQLQSNGTTELTVTSTGVTVADNLLFNSGYGSAATAYGCRAWVNFNGVSGTSIRGSGNISSVTRSSAGRYDVNFTNAMPDANYAVSAMLNGDSGTGTGAFNANGLWGANNRAVGSLRVEFYATSYVDSALCDVAIFR